jgi:hypothetical protein
VELDAHPGRLGVVGHRVAVAAAASILHLKPFNRADRSSKGQGVGVGVILRR